MYNSLQHAKMLEKVGVPREQAETHAQLMTEVIETQLATKQDLKDQTLELRTEFHSEIQNLRSEMNVRFERVHSEIKQLEYRMTIKLGTIVTVALGTFTAIVKFL